VARTPVAQLALDAGAQRRIISLTGRLTLHLELPHPRLNSGEPAPCHEVRMRTDGAIGQRPGIGVGLAHERPAHAANPVLTVTMRILAFILAADALKPDGI